jgi:hypothetical protein
MKMISCKQGTERGKSKPTKEKVKEASFSSRFRKDKNRYALGVRKEGILQHRKRLLKKFK